MTTEETEYSKRSEALTLSEHMAVYETFRNYVRHEDSLINNRMTWLLSIHGFLYATYGFTIQKRIEIVEKYSIIISRTSNQEAAINTKIYGEFSRIPLLLLEMEIFLIIISIVGILISWFALKSITAAKQATSNMQNIFNTNYYVEERESVGHVFDVRSLNKQKVTLPDIAGGGNPYAKKFGLSGSMTTPWILIFSWVAAVAMSVVYLLSNGCSLFFPK